ncbi:ABC transporter ATP-binding protein [bacterium]|nr:ABC transporter ATP-binding protein [bacterium]
MQVSKRFGKVVAVDELSLKVEDGEFMVLVGPSGCGKTTILRMIAGLAEPSGGGISIAGADVTGEPPGRRNLAMVFQNYALFPHMTVERNLSFGMRLRRVGADERKGRVVEVARLLRIDGLLARFPRELSGGQQQRVALGRALIRTPQAFLLDEPLSNLDQALRVEMRAEIAQLHKKYPVTTVYVTHDQVEAMTMGDRLAVLSEGRLMQLGTPHEIYNNPRNLFTAGFIGSPAMNLVPLHAARDESGRMRLEHRDGLALEVVFDAIGELPEEVVLGVRPEHLRLCEPAATNAIGAKVSLVEELGREHIVHMERGGLSLRLVLQGRSVPKMGDRVHVALDERQLYFFDPATGKRLSDDSPFQS